MHMITQSTFGVYLCIYRGFPSMFSYQARVFSKSFLKLWFLGLGFRDVTAVPCGLDSFAHPANFLCAQETSARHRVSQLALFHLFDCRSYSCCPHPWTCYSTSEVMLYFAPDLCLTICKTETLLIAMYTKPVFRWTSDANLCSKALSYVFAFWFVKL